MLDPWSGNPLRGGDSEMTDPLAVGPNIPPPVTTDAKASAKSSGGAIAAFTGGALLVIFMVQNTEDVILQLFFWEFTWPLWLVVSCPRLWVR